MHLESVKISVLVVLFFHFPPCHFSAQISMLKFECGSPARFLLLQQNTHTKQTSGWQESCCPEVRSEMITLPTPILTESSLFYWTWLNGTYLTQPSNTASTCKAPWKMRLLRVFTVICKFWTVLIYFCYSNSHFFILSFSLSISLCLISQIWLLFVQLRMMLLVRKSN